MYFPEGLEDTPFNWKIFSNFVAFSEYPNFNYIDYSFFFYSFLDTAPRGQQMMNVKKIPGGC